MSVARFLLAVASMVVAMPAVALARADDRATVTVSNDRAGARPVALAIALHTELQCGRLRPGAVTLDLPPRAPVGPDVPASSVVVGGIPARAVTLTGRRLTIVPSRPAGMTCDSISTGVARIAVTRGARIGNPPTPGVYTIVVGTGGRRLPARLTIR